MFKKLVTMLAVILGIVAYAPPAVAQSEDGLGFREDYATMTCIVSDGTNAVGNVIIPDYYNGCKVVGIREYAFHGNDDITGVSISDNVEFIGADAFRNCANLTTVKLPYNLKGIGCESFAGTSLETVYLNNIEGWCNLSIEGGYNFTNPLAVEHLFIDGVEATAITINIPEGVEELERELFSGVRITTVKFPSTLKRIGCKTFENCPIENLDFPDSLESIGIGAFVNSDNLKSVSFGKGIKYIGNYAFAGDNMMNSVSCPSLDVWLGIEFGVDPLYPEDNYGGGYGANPLGRAEHFYIGSQELTELVIPEGVEEIKQYAFYGGKNITTLTLPESLKSIGSYAFSGCRSITSVKFPESLRYIGDYAFQACGFTSLTIPNNLEYLGKSAFNNNDVLTSVELPSDMTSLPQSCFQYCKSLKSIDLPKGLLEIGGSAFSNSGIESITLPASVERIGDFAFSGCKIKSIKYPEGVTIIGKNTFSECRELESVDFPSSLKTIDGAAFKGCYKLKRVYLPKSLENIGAQVFEKLDEVHCSAENPPTMVWSSFKTVAGTYDYDTILYVPSESLDEYKEHALWGKFLDIREEGTSGIESVGEDVAGFEVGADGVSVSAGTCVDVYSLSGAKLRSGAEGFVPLSRGCYILVIDGTAHKVMID